MMDAMAEEDRPRPSAEDPVGQGVESSIEPKARGEAKVQPERIVRQAEPANAQLLGVLNENRENSGMEMQMKMAVDMVEGKLRRAKFVELSVNFCTELGPKLTTKKITEASGGRTIGEFLSIINKV